MAGGTHAYVLHYVGCAGDLDRRVYSADVYVTAATRIIGIALHWPAFSYVAAMLALMALLEVLPYVEELIRGVRAERRRLQRWTRLHRQRSKRKLKRSRHSTGRSFWCRDPDRPSRLSGPGRWNP